MNSMEKIVLAAILPLALAACGGGGGAAVVTPPQQKSATITFSTAVSTPTAPLQGIQITVNLPAGTTISNPATALTTPAGLLSTGLAYSAVNQTATFGVASTALNGFIPFGPFAELKCDITPGVTLTQSSFDTVNTPSFPDLQMSGIVNGTSVDLVHPVQQIPVTMSVTFVSQ